MSEEGSEIYQAKSGRLEQINRYINIINIIEAIKDNQVLDGLTKAFPYYPEPLQDLMKHEDSNLYSMVLRPRHKDDYLRFVNPVFSVKRDGADEEQVFYQALTQTYKGAKPLDTKAMLIAKIANTEAGKNHNFEGMQQELKRQVNNQFKKNVDFTKDSKGEDQLEAVLKKLPLEAKAEVLASPQIKKLQAPKFLTLVSQGKQNEAAHARKTYALTGPTKINS